MHNAKCILVVGILFMFFMTSCEQPVKNTTEGTQTTQESITKQKDTPKECTLHRDCRFAHWCTDGKCTPSECHDDNPKLKIVAQKCKNEKICEFGDAIEQELGLGTCANKIVVESIDCYVLTSEKEGAEVCAHTGKIKNKLSRMHFEQVGFITLKETPKGKSETILKFDRVAYKSDKFLKILTYSDSESKNTVSVAFSTETQLPEHISINTELDLKATLDPKNRVIKETPKMEFPPVKNARLEVRLISEEKTRLILPTWDGKEKFYLMDELFISVQGVETIKKVHSGGELYLQITLTQESKKTLTGVTDNNKGKKMALIVGEEIVLYPKIKTTVTSGIIVIDNVSEKKLAGLFKILTGQ